MSVNPATFSRSLAGVSPGHAVRVVLTRGWVAVRNWIRVASTRQGLTEMDDRMLADLGISRAQAQFELSRTPWTPER